MKTCNNCGTLNDYSNEKCKGCQMPGNFSVPSNHVDQEEGQSLKLSCSNCGSHQPGEGSTCIHCRFPIRQNAVKQFSSQSIQLIRKVETHVGKVLLKVDTDKLTQNDIPKNYSRKRRSNSNRKFQPDAVMVNKKFTLQIVIYPFLENYFAIHIL